MRIFLVEYEFVPCSAIVGYLFFPMAYGWLKFCHAYRLVLIPDKAY